MRRLPRTMGTPIARVRRVHSGYPSSQSITDDAIRTPARASSTRTHDHDVASGRKRLRRPGCASLLKDAETLPWAPSPASPHARRRRHGRRRRRGMLARLRCVRTGRGARRAAGRSGGPDRRPGRRRPRRQRHGQQRPGRRRPGRQRPGQRRHGRSARRPPRPMPRPIPAATPHPAAAKPRVSRARRRAVRPARTRA